MTNEYNRDDCAWKGCDQESSMYYKRIGFCDKHWKTIFEKDISLETQVERHIKDSAKECLLNK